MVMTQAVKDRIQFFCLLDFIHGSTDGKEQDFKGMSDDEKEEFLEEYRCELYQDYDGDQIFELLDDAIREIERFFVQLAKDFDEDGVARV